MCLYVCLFSYYIGFYYFLKHIKRGRWKWCDEHTMEGYVQWTKFALLKSVLQKCADDDVSIKSKYPTFARTYPPVVQVTKSLVALLLHFKWMKFTMIVGSSHKQRTIADKLLEYAELFNITVNGKQEYVEPYVPFSNGNPFPGIVDRTYVDTRGKRIKVF